MTINKYCDKCKGNVSGFNTDDLSLNWQVHQRQVHKVEVVAETKTSKPISKPTIVEKIKKAVKRSK